MACYHPITAWRSKQLNPTGKRSLVFQIKDAIDDDPVVIPCGQCVGCRLERSRQWAIRCVHEASLYDSNCFITLTYNDDCLPSDRSLDVREFQLFMKRLRKKYGSKIRFFHCGEYGEQYGRPHYHACLFNFDFPDKELWKTTKTGDRLYTSESLQALWPFGYSTIGDVTFESAAYVARYIMKKVTGEKADDHYVSVDKSTGEVLGKRKPEYTTMSRRPGLGKAWLERFNADVYPGDFVVLNGKKMRPPKYYDAQLQASDPYLFEQLKDNRELLSYEHIDNCTPDRLLVRETVQLARLKNLPRELHEE